MRARRFKQSDSTGLLLDTVCNVFGGIILIALLIAILARETESQLKTDINPDARTELLQRRIERITVENRRIRLQNEAKEKELAELTNPQIGKLLNSIEASKQKLDSVRHAIVNLQRELETSQLDADDLLEKIEQDKAEADAELAKEMLHSTQLEAKLSQLKKQEQELIEQRKAAKEKQTVRMRLPRERKTGQEQVWVLVRYGKLYPTYLRQGITETRNNVSIRWTEKFGSQKAEPISKRGIAVLRNDREWKSYLQALDSRREFVAFVVWPDSYKAFNLAKASAVSRGMSYGWEIQEASEDIYFSSVGSVPSPQ